MHIAIATIEGVSPYSSSKHIDRDEHPEKPKELKDEYEQRTWRHRLHVTPSGHVFIPGVCFAQCVKGAARRLQLWG